MEPIPENAVPLQERRFKHAGQAHRLGGLDRPLRAAPSRGRPP